MAFRSTSFPIAEGAGIFVGVLAWDLLSEGQLNLVKALAIAVPCTIVWFALRYWKQKSRHSQH